MLTVFLIFIVLLAFIFLGFPIFMSLLITGILFLTLGGNSLGLTVIKMFGSANSLSLLAIPYFVIAGNIIMKARITDKLVNFADAAVGWLPGGLGHVNVLTSMIFGGIQGSGCADAAAIGGMADPCHGKAGIRQRLFCGSHRRLLHAVAHHSAQHRHDPVFLLYRGARGTSVPWVHWCPAFFWDSCRWVLCIWNTGCANMTFPAPASLSGIC